MHGRLKVKTTAEQEEAKRIEREKKVKAYLGATKKIFEKRKIDEHDKEMLELTAQLLSANPDFYTLWNIRREVFNSLNERKSKDETQEQFDQELYFVEQCLKLNPKSYGSWQHRCWLMDTMPRPDWKTELALCNKYLEYDERNFHCWDYRRFIVQRSAVPAEEEFAFSTSKISSNFSNYSSWHYRSKLLPLIHPDPTHPVGVREETLLQEFELAQNAFFTDPNDQSAWFYHRWLLGTVEKSLAIETVVVSRTCATLVVCFTRPAKLGANLTVQTTVNGVILEDEEWVSPSGSQYSIIWTRPIEESLLSIDAEVEVAVELSTSRQKGCHCMLKPGQTDAFWKQDYKPGAMFSCELGAATTSILSSELESCQQLDELEPDNKWTMLTIVSLLRALQPLEHLQQALEYLEKIRKIDSMRNNYYLDLKSKFLIENALESQPSENREFCLSNQSLTAVYHLEHLTAMTRVDLSRNALSSMQDGHCLQSARSLILDGNKLTSCNGLRALMSLEELSLKNNSLSQPEDLLPLSTCGQLVTLNLAGNPICDQDDALSAIQTILPNVKICMV